MPKSKHGKGKYQPRKRKIIPPAEEAATQASTGEARPAATASAVKSSPVRPGTKAGAPVLQYPYVMSDLKRVAIVAGVVIVIMIILAIIFS